MTAVAEAEVTAVHAPGAEIAAYVPPAGGVIEEYRARFVMQPDEAKALSDQLYECMRAILVEGVDYGTIPGAGDKKNLLKPGAEKLLQWFGFGSDTTEVKTERDDPERPCGIADKARRIGVTYRTEVTKTVPGVGKVLVASCEGYAGFDEDRYYVTEEEARAKAKAKEERNARKYHRDAEPWKWETAAEYRAPWNTLVKMAQKRSYVGAAIDATGAAGLFTQDMEDAAPAAAVPEGPKFGDVAMKALRALDKPVLEAVGQWYRGKQWPDPRDWDAEQWCAALQAAGFIAGQGFTQQQAAKQAAPEPPPAGQAEAGPSAYEKALARLDQGDDWTQRIKDIAEGDDGEAARLIAEVDRTRMNDAKRHLLRTAITARFPGATQEPEAA